ASPSGRDHQSREKFMRNYFSVGTIMPRMMMFWQKIKTVSVGRAASTRAAKITGIGAQLCIWESQTISVHLFGSWQTRNAQRKLPYAAVKVPSAMTASTGFDIGRVIVVNIRASEAPSIVPASYSSLGKLSKNPLSRKIE